MTSFKSHFLPYILIATIAFLIYSPALFHGPRADQVTYLSEVFHQKDFFQLTFGNWDLTRSSQLSHGDELLFRPLLYFILGLEKYVFGYNFLLWQLVSVILHLFVLWHLLKLLLLIKRTFWAYFLTGFFAVMFPNAEMISWHHVSSYLFSMALLLMALYQFVLILREDGTIGTRINWMAFYLGLACFIYEIFVLWTIFIGAFLLLNQRRKKADTRSAWRLFIPVAIYFVLYFIRFLIPSTHGPVTEERHAFALLSTFENLGKVISFWVLPGIFPTEFKFIPAGRMLIGSESTWFSGIHMSLGCIVSFGLVGLIAAAIFLTLKHYRISLPWPLIGVLSAMILILIGIVTLGRVNPRGFADGLGGSFYYHYVFWILMIVIIYVLMCFSFEQIKSRYMAMAFASVILSANIFIHAQLTHQLMRFYETAHKPEVLLIRTVELLIQEKSHEPDFSFYADHRYPGNYGLSWAKKEDGTVYTVIEYLFPGYSKPFDQAKYKFLIKETP